MISVKMVNEAGPFYSGLNVELIVSSFLMRCYSPTSSSKHLEIATRFSDEEGIIIQFNNTGHQYAHRLPIFNCSFISTFPEEDERLIFGGSDLIRIEGIRLIQTCTNYQTFFKCLFIFDSILNGASVNADDLNICDVDYKILNKLISVSYSKMDEYLINTWNKFIIQKQTIIINLDKLSRLPSNISSLIMQSGIKKRYEALPPDSFNLFDSSLFSIFSNLKTIIIYTTWFDNLYSFNLYSFLSIINKSSTWTKIRILAKRGTWILALFDNKKEWRSILSAYDETKLNIKMETTKTVYDCVFISRVA